jgi:predicted nicotinamide N-methyase
MEKNTREAYGIKFLLSQHKAIRSLKRSSTEPSIHGNKFWGSSYLIMDYLQQHPLKKGSNVMEVGCGWGLAGIYCAKKFQARVTAIDADDAVFPYLHLHAEYNKVHIDTQKKYFEKITTKQLSHYDVLIGADICFWDELADSVFNLINRAIKAGVKKIIISDPEREPFFTLSERCIDKFYAELEPWSVSKPRQARGSLLIIENA